MTDQDTNPTVPRSVTATLEAEPASRKDWRTRYASAVLIGVLVLGFLVLTPNIYFESTPWLTLVFFAVYALAGTAVAWRGSVALKTAASMVVLGASGIAAILGGGSPANGTFFFVALVTVITLLGSPRSGTIATAITLVLLVVAAGLSGAGLVGIAGGDSALHAPAGWIGTGLAVLMFGAALVLGIGHLQRGRGLPMASEQPSPAEDKHVAPTVSAQPTADRSQWLRKALETGRKLSASHASEDAAVGLVTSVQSVFGYPQVAVFIVNASRDQLVLAAHAGEGALSAEQLPLEGNSLAAQAARSGLAQTAAPQSLTGESGGGEDTVVGSKTVVPIMSEDVAIGALLVRARDGDPEPDELEALGWVAAQAAVLLAAPRAEEPPAVDTGIARAIRQPRLARPWEHVVGEGAIEYEFGDRDLPESAPQIEVPLSLRDEEIGTISLATDADWSAEERSLVEAVATQAALALENARLMEASQLSASREHTLAEITAKVWGAATLDGVLRTAVQELAQAFGADRAIIELRADTDDDQ